VTRPLDTMEEAPVLGVPLLEPTAVEGCDTCQRLAAQREQHRAAGDETAVSDCNVWLRRHPGHEHRVVQQVRP